MKKSYEYVVETFEEIPEGYLHINKNSNYYYVKHLNKKYIALFKLNMCANTKLNGKEVIICINDYINVLDGKLILREKVIYSMFDKHKISSDIKPTTKIIPLNKLFGDSGYKLNIDDVSKTIKNKTLVKGKLNG